MSRTEEFEQARPRLFSIAYRILGNVSEAEDAVHETWRCYEAEPAEPASGKAFLSATVTRISNDVLRSARVRHHEHTGQQSASTAAVLLLERLPPLERAVFVLREIFGCGPPEIASAVGSTEADCAGLAAAPLPWPRRIDGADLVARVLAAIVPALARIGVTMESQQVSCRPGAVFRDRKGKVLSALALDILDGQIQTIRWLVRGRPC
ncbi:sigma factor-like helix-turn-helix DNA-binding protein [Streptomyces sp. NPDC045251]|uniref:sigma factor-like helix-turn-helix DNA-binding protein n=1 Tax=unclassified Streptomyces TaxID=2593676 RepID=UPI0033EDF0A9